MTENANLLARIKELIANMTHVGFYTCNGKTTTLIKREDLLELIEKELERNNRVAV